VIPDAFLIARDGETYASYSALWKRSVPDSLTQSMTATRPEYCRKGIATALKVLVTEWAKNQGYSEILTWNDATNNSMLHINIKLGFE